jgi:hypothetical protein
MLLRWELKAAPGVHGPGAERPYVTRAAVPEAEADDGHARGASLCSHAGATVVSSLSVARRVSATSSRRFSTRRAASTWVESVCWGLEACEA